MFNLAMAFWSMSIYIILISLYMIKCIVYRYGYYLSLLKISLQFLRMGMATIATKLLARQSKMNIIVYPVANENDIQS